MSSKQKSGYSDEFKVKVLEYYFRNGGDNKFGVKAKTAQYFSIDHKTVARMLANDTMVKKAQDSLLKKFDKGKLHGSKESTDSALNHLSTDVQKKRIRYDLHRASTNEYPEVAVTELPEDPDYSILKQTIEASANGAGGIAKLLVSGTDEVRRVVTSECDLIYECRVCRNLFRSVINFLAHKRLYCQDKFCCVQTPFPKDPEPNLSTEMNEPKLGLIDHHLPKKPNLETIVSNLSSKKQCTQMQVLTSPTAFKYSPHLQRLRKDSEMAYGAFKEPRILLRNIDGISSAMYQTRSSAEDNKLILSRKRKSLDDASNSYHKPEHKTFEAPKVKIERSPNSTSTSAGQNPFKCKILHKKNKRQRERLRQVIANRAYKKVLNSELLDRLRHRNGATTNEDSKTLEFNVKPVVETVLPLVHSASHENPLVQLVFHDSPLTLPTSHDCPKCGQKFTAPEAATSHAQRCMCIKDEEPKKKIEIQIRKDYKKEIPPSSPPHMSNAPRLPSSSIRKDIIAEIKKVCKIDKLYCIPCDRRYQTAHVLKRHIAQHIKWTRFACAICHFRSYERYTCLQHCASNHGASQAAAYEMVLNDEQLESCEVGDENGQLLQPCVHNASSINCEGDLTSSASSSCGESENEVQPGKSGDVQPGKSMDSLRILDENKILSKSELKSIIRKVAMVKIEAPQGQLIHQQPLLPKLERIDVKGLNASSCNVRNISIINVKDVRVKRISTSQIEKLNGDENVAQLTPSSAVG